MSAPSTKSKPPTGYRSRPSPQLSSDTVADPGESAGMFAFTLAERRSRAGFLSVMVALAPDDVHV